VWCGTLCQAVLLGQHFSMILWLLLSLRPPRRINSVSQGNACQLCRYIFSKQDRAWPHTTNAELDVLKENSDNQVLSNHFPEWLGYGCSWPQYSLNVNPYNYFLWGFVKDKFTKATHDQMKNWNKKFQQLCSASVNKLQLQLCGISDISGHGCQWCTY
jgi:hypothetical protein